MIVKAREHTKDGGVIFVGDDALKAAYCSAAQWEAQTGIVCCVEITHDDGGMQQFAPVSNWSYVDYAEKIATYTNNFGLGTTQPSI